MMQILQGKTLLIVEDEEALREPLAQEFNYLGCQVLQAANGKQGFELANQHSIDAIISDIRMPGGDGVELLRNIKQVNHARPVVMLITGFSDLSREDAYHMGAEAIVAKPFDLDDIEAAVARILQPREIRWQQSVDRGKIKHVFQKRCVSMAQATEDRDMALGRGGLFLNIGANPPPLNGRILFDITFDQGDVSGFDGVGIVRWVRSRPDGSSPPGAGVEIESLSDATRASVIRHISNNTQVSFIPKG